MLTRSSKILQILTSSKSDWIVNIFLDDEWYSVSIGPSVMWSALANRTLSATTSQSLVESQRYNSIGANIKSILSPILEQLVHSSSIQRKITQHVDSTAIHRSPSHSPGAKACHCRFESESQKATQTDESSSRIVKLNVLGEEDSE